MSLQTINTTLLPSTAMPLSVSAKSAAVAEAVTTVKAVENPAGRSASVDPAKLQEAVKATNDFIKPINSSVEFSMDKDTGETVVKIVDTTTKEVIRQIPSEEMLSIAKALDKIQGLLIKQSA